MVKEHLFLREYTGKPWSRGSHVREYLEKLPLANEEENFNDTNTQYLLPRKNILTFGLPNGIFERVVYYQCKMCRSLVKPHEIKSHMLVNHIKQEASTSSGEQSSIGSQPVGSKSKKSSHKSKKKVVPPSVPPPPLFPKIEFSSSGDGSSSEDLLPPVLHPAELDDTKALIVKQEKNDEKIVSTSVTLNLTTTVTLSKSVAPAAVLIPSTNAVIVTSTTTTPSFLPPTLATQVSKKSHTHMSHSSSSSKTKERLKDKESDGHKRRRSKRSRNCEEYSPDKHCGVLDAQKRPCLRTLTCCNHTIIERRAVSGRSKSLDKLISEYKASRTKSKPPPILPAIAPKQCSHVEAKPGLRIIELIYGDDTPSDADFQYKAEDPFLTNFMKEIASKAAEVYPKVVKPPSSIVPVSDEVEKIRKLPKVSLAPVYMSLSQSSPPHTGLKGAEVPSQSPSYATPRKLMTVLTSPLRRIGSTFVLQQQAQRLERQRLDMQAVVNEHKQAKLATSIKQMAMLNSNHKQSILKNNIKNNIKLTSLKRSTVEKTNVAEIKHIKILPADMNGFLLNSDFVESTEATADALLK